MANRRRYQRRERILVTAVQLALDTAGFTYKKWGHTQRCKAGDWLVDSDGDVYTVDRDVFARTYRERQPGRFEKTTSVWAEEAQKAGSIRTHEGRTDYKPGDFLVFNDAQGEDGWAMTGQRFRALYVLVE